MILILAYKYYYESNCLQLYNNFNYSIKAIAMDPFYIARKNVHQSGLIGESIFTTAAIVNVITFQTIRWNLINI